MANILDPKDRQDDDDSDHDQTVDERPDLSSYDAAADSAAEDNDFDSGDANDREE